MSSSSQRVNLLHPLKTMFLTTSKPKGPRPYIKISALDCLLTASIPIAPMYLLHLSRTFSSLMSSYFPSIFSYETSISYSLAPFKASTFFDSSLRFFSFLAVCFGMMSVDFGGGNFASSSSSYLIAFSSISLYWVFDFLNYEAHETLWSFTRPT